MSKKLNSVEWLIELLLIFILVIGLVFRLIGISRNLSMWNDEGYVAIIARNLIQSGRFETPAGQTTGIYQFGLYGVTALSYLLFGVNEWSGRIVSVVVGMALVYLAYNLVGKLISKRVGLVTSFLLAFSQIQLAWSTQIRPYIWLELFTLVITFYLYQLIVSPWKQSKTYLVPALIFSLIASLFHGIGLENFVIVGGAFVYKAVKEKQLKYLYFIPILIIVCLLILYRSSTDGWSFVTRILFNFSFDPLHYRIFLTHNYLWLIFGAFVGFINLQKRNTELAVLLGGSILFIFAMAIFKINSNYVRYSLPAFPLMYVLFAECTVFIISKITQGRYLQVLLIMLVFGLLSYTGKFVFWPKYYYSINADMRENPIVDYKLAFSKIKDLIKDKDDVLVIDSWNDRVPLYLSGQKFVMTNYSTQSEVDSVFGEKFVRSLDEVKSEIASHKNGVVIVEDWQSFMSEDIKEYVQKPKIRIHRTRFAIQFQ